MTTPSEMSITAEQGQLLLGASASFELPEKLGEVTTFSPVERTLAKEDVRQLFRALKALSPGVQKRGREFRLIFGRPENWSDLKDNANQLVGYRMIDSNEKVDLSLSEEAVNGACWCLLLLLHPVNLTPCSPRVAEEVVWPLARALGQEANLRKELGLDSVRQSRWKKNGDPDLARPAAVTVRD